AAAGGFDDRAGEVVHLMTAEEHEVPRLFDLVTFLLDLDLDAAVVERLDGQVSSLVGQFGGHGRDPFGDEGDDLLGAPAEIGAVEGGAEIEPYGPLPRLA